MPIVKYQVTPSEIVNFFNEIKHQNLSIFNNRVSQDPHKYLKFPYIDLSVSENGNSFYLFFYENEFKNQLFQIEQFRANNGQLYFGMKNMCIQPPHIIMTGSTFSTHPKIYGEFVLNNRYYINEQYITPSNELRQTYKTLSKTLKRLSKPHLARKSIGVSNTSASGCSNT